MHSLTVICYVLTWVFFVASVLMLGISFLNELVNFKYDKRPLWLRVLENRWVICAVVNLVVFASIYFIVRG